jgi:hypothetical protein
MPPRSLPLPSGNALTGGAIGMRSVLSSCISVACCTVTGTASAIFCANFMPSCAEPASAATVHARLLTLNGTSTSNATSADAPAAMATVCAGNDCSPADAASDAFIAAFDVLRSVNIAL